MNTSRGRNWLLLLLVGLVMGVAWPVAPVAAAPFAYVANQGSGTVSVIDTATNMVVGNPIPVGSYPQGVAITPDGKRVYVANGDADTVSVIDTATNTVVGTPIYIGRGSTLQKVAITPDGKRVYVTNSDAGTVSVIDTATNTVVGNPIPVGVDYAGPTGLVVTPDGKRVYVANENSYPGTVTVIDTATNTVVGNPIPVGEDFPMAVAVTPDGKHVYVTSALGIISVIDTATNTVVGNPIPVGTMLYGVAVTSDGKYVYVADTASNTVLVIDTATNTVVGSPIPVGSRPSEVAITPAGSEAGPRLARWKQTTALPQASAASWFTGRPMPIINGRAYLIGGRNAKTMLTDAYYSAINTDGTLGPWVQTTPIPGSYFDYAVVAIGSYVYLITGANGDTAVYYALILPDGRIGIWTSTQPLVPSRQNFAAAASGNFIYVSGGNSGGTISRVEYTSVKPDGTLNPWQLTTALPVPLEGHGMVATHGRLYVVAPSYVVAPNGAAYYATINPDGTVGNWTQTTTPPAPVSSYSTFESNGYLYLVGGNPNSSYYAQIQSDGALSEWQPTTLLPNIRMGARIGTDGHSVYVAGGYDGTNFFKTVFYSHLAAKVGGSATGLQVAGVSCINNKASQTVNVADPAATWNCEEAGLTVNAKDGIQMTVTGSVDLTAPVGGSASGLLLNKVRCINDSTRPRQTVDIDMSNTPPSWNCEAAGLQVHSRDMIRMNINGGAE